MRLARLTRFASIGLILFVAAGCYRPYGAPYGTPGGAPYGVPGAPVQTLTPGSPYTPTYPQGTPGAVPTPADPSGTPNSTFEQNGSGDSSPFYPPNSSSLPPYNERRVPNPRDPGEVQFQQQSSPQPVADEYDDLIEHGALEGAGASTANVAKIPLDTAEFYAPKRVPLNKPPKEHPEGVAVASGSPTPFAHDADGYRWLRGLARRNESTGVWSLIYNTVEVDADPFQGWLTLASDPQLADLVPNGAYLISGRLDESQTDTAGKPMYRVESITPWHPSTTQ